MVSWFRWLTVCWLVLAMPLQGMAAAAMGHGGTWQLPAPAARLGHPPADLRPTDHAHPADHADHALVAADAPTAQDAPAGHADPLGHSGHSGPHSCSVCAACCTALAMPPLALSLPAAPPMALWQAAQPQGRVGFVTGGPDRPPRPRLH